MDYKINPLAKFLIDYFLVLISTNNITIGLVRAREIRFQPTKYVFVHSFTWSSEPANLP
jgi:hypothetical protein